LPAAGDDSDAATIVDPLALPCTQAQLGSAERDPIPFEQTWERAIDAIFAAEDRPRFVIYLAGAHILLLEAHKWVQGRWLRLDLDMAIGRKDDKAFTVAAALCSRETLVPDGEQLLHDRLEENAHKHAYGVTKDLKHGIIEAVELLANCWASHELERRRALKRKLFDDDDPQGRATARELKTQCMRYLYRLLFLFYVEARPDLEVVPMLAEAYRLGYSLEALRDLEQAALTNPHARDGSYFQQHLERLFDLIYRGHPTTGASATDQQQTLDTSAPLDASEIVDGGFTLKAQVAELFDPSETPLLNSAQLNAQLKRRRRATDPSADHAGSGPQTVPQASPRGLTIPNHILQQIIQKLSLSTGSRRHGRGRISYATLGIEQLGSVYESLLSYSGFFATEPLIELKRKQDKQDDPEIQTWFAPETDRERFHKDELLWDDRDDGRGKAYRVIPEGTFVFRLAGRDRAESASFYTPKVLTEALVKYSLMELIDDGIKPLAQRQDEQRRIAAGEMEVKQLPTADEILDMSVLDSATSSWHRTTFHRATPNQIPHRIDVTALDQIHPTSSLKDCRGPQSDRYTAQLKRKHAKVLRRPSPECPRVVAEREDRSSAALETAKPGPSEPDQGHRKREAESPFGFNKTTPFSPRYKLTDRQGLTASGIVRTKRKPTQG
ncbi:MAG: hypothetical protein PF961_20150, partial [Planctomycetota bacterium]|nr:hypothetical protein [Planctomycetota bacterium]